MIKSYSFHSHNINKDKLNIIKNYAILIRNNKNMLSQYLYDNFKLDIFYNNLSKYDFINKTKDLRDNIGSSFYQQCQQEVYTRYQNQIENLDLKIKNTKLSITIKYLIKTYNNYHNNKENLINYLSNSNKKYHKEILNHINKYKDRLFNLVNKIQNRLIKKMKMIEFKSLTFNGINQLGNKQKMIELSKNIKITNSVINLNIPKIEKIIIPTRYNKKYHGNLNEYKYSYTKQNQSQISYKCKIYDNKIQIILTREIINNDLKLEIDNENTIGIDVNTKNNLFSLSDNNFIRYDKWLMDKYRKYEKYIARIQRNKEKRNLDKQYGKKVMKRINKMNRISKAYSDMKSNELVKHCMSKNIKHIIMENLNLRSKNKYKYKKNGINYKNIIKILHLNDYKNVIKRIANKFNIMVSWVNPEYTSQTCPCCGYISKDNRKTQETFSCIRCDYSNNADINAAINIKNRIHIPKLRDKLMEYNFKENMFIGKVYISKQTYIDIYKNLNYNNQ
jgi:putative transposase